ncbi:uncharacterized protein METZ01_LOCUS260786 [marine metagenome]|uniref:Uncharacterized protein n=1 Tax=marine metagenome TaxID=408172 RepID=A0A382J961_9ZZZZ
MLGIESLWFAFKDNLEDGIKRQYHS